MSCDGAYCKGTVPVCSVPVCRSVEDPRGARHESALSCLTMMQSCASAAKLWAAGPFSPSAFGATSATGSRHLGSSTGSPVVDASSERRAGKEMILQRFVSLPDAG